MPNAFVVEPVTVRLYRPAIAAVHENLVVKLGGSVPLLLMGWHVRPESGLVRRYTVPVNPFCPVTAIVTFDNLPTITVAGMLMGVIVKSVIVKLAVAVWLSVLNVPVTVRV